MVIKKEIFSGNERLKAIDINTHRPGVNIWIDFMHIYPFDPSEEFSTHAHENCEFHYIAEGEGEVGFLKDGYDISSVVRLPAKVKSKNKPSLHELHLRDKNWEDEKYVVFKLKKGDAFFNPPGQFCWQKSSENAPLIEYAIRFCFEEIESDEGEGMYFKKENSIINKLLNQDIIQVTERNEHIRQIFENVFLEARNEMPGYITKIKNDIYNLIVEIARSVWNKRHLSYFVPEVDKTKLRLRLIDEFITANIASNIKIKDLAKNVYLSERSLSRFVKAKKGVSVHKYILQIKINMAVEYIVEDNMTLNEIAVLTGFSSPHHLSSTIKKLTGKNPSQL